MTVKHAEKKEIKKNQLPEKATLDLFRIGYKKAVKENYSENEFLAWAKNIWSRVNTINKDIKYVPALENIQ